jgi:hypothetical protein
VARAKRTDRADARRRYRLAQEDLDETGSEAETPVPNILSSSRGSKPSAAGSTVPGGRMGFADSMRAAYHRPDIRADIAALPWLLRTRAFLIPLALVVVGVAAVVAVPTNYAGGLFFQLMVLPPAMAPIFIVGFFAKRASYLLGFIVAVVDVIGYAIFVYAVLPTVGTDTVTAASQQELILSAVGIGPLSGVFFAAGAAWYRRFLNYSSAQRARAKPGQQHAKPGQQRGKASRPARG